MKSREAAPRLARADEVIECDICQKIPIISWRSHKRTASASTRRQICGFRASRVTLSESGFVEGQNLAIEYRWAEDRYGQLPALATDLVDRKVDVIAAPGSNSALAAKS